MHATLAPARPRASLLLALVVAASLLAACNITWTYNRNFGIVTEATAARASLSIYRAPRKLLYSVLDSYGIGTVQGLIYDNGRGPFASVPEICIAGYCVGQSMLLSEWHDLVYGRTSDLQSALVDAQNALDCLDLTVISYATWAPNWTHKSVGCEIGQV